MKACPKCGFESSNPTECPSCGIIFSKYVAPVQIPKAVLNETTRRTLPAPEPSRSGDRWALLGALPIAFLFAWLAKKFFPTEIVFEACRLWIHEFGHAAIAWLSGRAATPLGFGWTNFNPERSMIVFVCFAFLLGVSIWKSVEAKAWALTSALGLLFLLQLFFTFVLSEAKFEVLMAYGGVGAEFYLGALLVIAFFFKFPPQARWDFFRYPVLLIGAYSFFNTFLLWIRISHDQASIPWGTLLFGETDAGGDMNQLIDIFGWTKKELIRMYVRTGAVCALGVAGTYLYSLARFFRLRRISAKSSPS